MHFFRFPTIQTEKRSCRDPDDLSQISRAAKLILLLLLLVFLSCFCAPLILQRRSRCLSSPLLLGLRVADRLIGLQRKEELEKKWRREEVVVNPWSSLPPPLKALLTYRRKMRGRKWT